MEKKIIEVLLVEKNAKDVALVKELLLLQRDVDNSFHLQVAKDVEFGKNLLKQIVFDVMLMDLSSPDENPLKDFEILHQLSPNTPIVTLTSKEKSELGAQAMRAGAQDYLVKDNIESGLLTRSLIHAIERGQLIQRLEQSLRTEIEERKKMDLLKDEFVSTVSHELRTPLAIVKSAIENLRDGIAGDLTEKQGRTVQIAARNLDRLTTIINDLLDLSRLESGKMVLNRHRVSMASMVQELFQGYQAQARAKNVRLVADIPADVPEVYVDPDLIVQVLNNLMNNCLRYTKSKIVVKIARKNGSSKSESETFKSMVVVSITDDGEGIAPEDMGKLFGKFQQINRPTGGAGYKGTGLGLAICREIISQHEGTIWAESELGKGASFLFTLEEYQPEYDFWPKITATFEEARLNKEALAVLAISIENLRDLKKTKSDEEIHEVFNKIQSILKSQVLRRGDKLFHYSQKEFIAVVAQTGKAGALLIKDRISKVLSDISSFRFRVSFAIFPEDGSTPEIVLKKAIEGPENLG